MKGKVVIPEDTIGLHSSWREEFRSAGFEIVSGSGRIDPQSLRELICDADAILARAAASYTPEVLEAAEHLKIVARFGVGYDNIDVPYCTSKGIYVTITPEANYFAVAEHAVGLMIACAHRFPTMHNAGKQGIWNIRNTLETHTLTHKTVGIIGLGRIGRKVAEICEKGLQMNVLGYDPYVKGIDTLETLRMADKIEDVFAGADVVSLHLPYSQEWKNLVDKRMLELMKPTAVLINTARGGFIDEDALYEALKNGTIFGAGLETRAEEPPKQPGPLFECDNVIITPHCSALSCEVSELTGQHAAQEVYRVLTGQKPKWAINTF